MHGAQVPEADEVFAAYQLAESSIQQFMQNTHNEWFTLTNEQSLARELNANLLTVDKAAGAYSARVCGCGCRCLRLRACT